MEKSGRRVQIPGIPQKSRWKLEKSEGDEEHILDKQKRSEKEENLLLYGSSGERSGYERLRHTGRESEKKIVLLSFREILAESARENEPHIS